MTNSCGKRRWSMISTEHPSAASQIVRIARPLTFIDLRLEHAAGDRVEPGDKRRVARGGGGDQRMVERVMAAVAARPLCAPSSGTTLLTSALAFSALANSTLRIASTVTASWPGCQQS